MEEAEKLDGQEHDISWSEDDPEVAQNPGAEGEGPCEPEGKEEVKDTEQLTGSQTGNAMGVEAGEEGAPVDKEWRQWTGSKEEKRPTQERRATEAGESKEAIFLGPSKGSVTD
jgi:hypothetical protein